MKGLNKLINDMEHARAGGYVQMNQCVTMHETRSRVKTQLQCISYSQQNSHVCYQTS